LGVQASNSSPNNHNLVRKSSMGFSACWTKVSYTHKIVLVVGKWEKYWGHYGMLFHQARTSWKLKFYVIDPTMSSLVLTTFCLSIFYHFCIPFKTKFFFQFVAFLAYYNIFFSMGVILVSPFWQVFFCNLTRCFIIDALPSS
jgi:hypothetical protein